MNSSRTWLSVSVAVGLMAGPAYTLTIETVTVGNPGNAADTRYPAPSPGGNGSVGYTYDIGKYEVTAGQYTEFLNAVAKTDTYGLYHPGSKIQLSGSPGNWSYSVPADRASRPVTFVSWFDGIRFANWMHNGQPTGEQNTSTTEDGSYDLSGGLADPPYPPFVTRRADATWVIPTADEWYKAAYHKNDGVTGNYWYYPTGTDTPPSNDLIDPDPGNNANFDQDGLTIGSPYYHTEVGEFENSPSPYGTFDQGGNVYEMTEFQLGRGQRLFRGGSYLNSSSSLSAEFGDSYHPANAELFFFGFRLARVPEPATMSLLALGGVGLLARRRR